MNLSFSSGIILVMDGNGMGEEASGGVAGRCPQPNLETCAPEVMKIPLSTFILLYIIYILTLQQWP
jgi:hypothetical protein